MANGIKYCRKCGTPAAKEARFCRKCGCPFAEEPKQTVPKSKYSSTGQLPGHSAIIPQVKSYEETFAASAAKGEQDLGEIFIPEPVNLSGASAKVPAFIKVPAFTGAALFAVLWFVLALFRGSDSGIVRILSWITFSEGGFDRSVPGMVGGMLGKGTVAAALISLFTGGLNNLFKGIGALFAGHGEKRGIFSILAGTVFGGLACCAFVGKNASADTAMAGIAGALLSLEALGSGSGRLYELARSLTDRKVKGIRTLMRGRCDGLLTGLTLGFVLAAAVLSL